MKIIVDPLTAKQQTDRDILLTKTFSSEERKPPVSLEHDALLWILLYNSPPESDEGDLMGCCAFGGIDENTGIIFNLAIKEEFRGYGFGTGLVAIIMDILKDTKIYVRIKNNHRLFFEECEKNEKYLFMTSEKKV